MLRVVYAIVRLGYARKIVFFPRLCSLLAPFRLPSVDFFQVSWFLRVSKLIDCPNCGFFCHKDYFSWAFVKKCTNMIYRKLMIIGSNVTAGWQLVPQGNSVCLGAFGKMSGSHCRRFRPSPHPSPYCLFCHSSQFSSRSRAFGKGKETAATQANLLLDVKLCCVWGNQYSRYVCIFYTFFKYFLSPELTRRFYSFVKFYFILAPL